MHLVVDDAELARRISDGPAPAAERELAARFARRIRLYGLRHLRSEDRAAELVQEVLVIVLEALRDRRVEDLDHIERFVLGTCRNVVSGWRRGERRRAGLAATLGAAADARAVAPAPPPEAALMRCLERLPAREQAILILSYCEEREADEIGGLLGVSGGNVRVIRHRALRVVKGCLEERRS